MMPEKYKTYTEGFYNGAKIVLDYMESKSKLIQYTPNKADTPDRDDCLKILFLRSVVSMRSLLKLNQISDFQDIVSINRRLMEFSVDIALLHNDKSNHSGWKMRCWSDSEKLRRATKVINHFNKQGQSIPEKYEELQKYHIRQEANINKLRITLWPNKKNINIPRHPDRWTNNKIFDDIQFADRLFRVFFENELGMDLTTYYQAEFSRLSWSIHSGVVGLFEMEPSGFDSTCGLAFKYCADFAMLITKIILIDFDMSKAIENVEEEWNNVLIQRTSFLNGIPIEDL